MHSEICSSLKSLSHNNATCRSRADTMHVVPNKLNKSEENALEFEETIEYISPGY